MTNIDSTDLAVLIARASDHATWDGRDIFGVYAQGVLDALRYVQDGEATYDLRELMGLDKESE